MHAYMMIVLCPKAGSLAFTPAGDEMSEVVSCCLPHRQLWVRNLSKVATKWLEVDSYLRPSGCKAQNISLHHCVPYIHSFIHSGDLYSTSSRDYYSEALPSQSWTKKKDFREM